MQLWKSFSGLAGLILVVFAGIGSTVLGFTHIFVLVHFFVGLILVLFWLVQFGAKQLASLRSEICRPKVQFGFRIFFLSVFLFLALLLINWSANQPALSFRWDLSEQKIHSLSEQSKKILSQLNQKIFLRAFLSNPTGTPAYELLQMYALENPLVVVEAYNPDLNPDLIERFGLSSGEVLHLSFGEDEHARQVRFREIKEESITNELLKFLRRGNLKAYFVVGHGEPDLDEDVAGGISLFTEALRQEGFLTEKLLLAQNKNVPDDARLVVLFPPQTPLLTEERQMLIQYVNQGGSLLILGDPVWPVQDNGERALAREFGIEIGFNLIVDPVQGRQGAAGVRPFVTNYATHPITDGFTEESVTAFDKASTVKVTRVSDETALSLELLTTSVSAWGETDLKSLISSDRPVITRDDADITGPVAIGAVYDKLIDGSSDPQKHSRVVAFGDSDWIRNHGFRIYFNRDLALNTVNWLSGDASTVAIRPRRFRSSFAPMSEAALRGLLAASFLLPEILLIGGLGMWWRRRVC